MQNKLSSLGRRPKSLSSSDLEGLLADKARLSRQPAYAGYLSLRYPRSVHRKYSDGSFELCRLGAQVLKILNFARETLINACCLENGRRRPYFFSLPRNAKVMEMNVARIRASHPHFSHT